MGDRRQNERPTPPEDVAEARLAALKFREGDDEKAILLAMANKINKRYGVVLGDTESPERHEKGPSSAQTDAGTKPSESQKPELSPEQKYLEELKTRFDAMPNLHKGVKWEDVEKSLKKDPEAMRKLQALDEKGHEMNIFRSENDGEIQFRTAQRDVTKIAAKYRTIMYDTKAETDYPKYRANGNAVDIAKSMGVELADKKLYEQLDTVPNWAGGYMKRSGKSPFF